jgi:hypothetical protein
MAIAQPTKSLRQPYKYEFYFILIEKIRELGAEPVIPHALARIDSKLSVEQIFNWLNFW